MLVLVGSAAVCLGTGEVEARSAVGEAEQRVNACYMAAAEAQKARANVTDLLLVLDDAGMLLCKAHLALEKGDFDSAYALAVESRAKLDGFDVEANALRDSASQARSMDFAVNVVGSGVGSVMVVVVAFVVWRLSKKEYPAPEGGV